MPRPVGTAVCCRYTDDARDQLYLVQFGLRSDWQPRGGRVRLLAGGGGAYFNHTFGPASGFVGDSGWGGQAAASASWAVTGSRRFWAGLTARYYYFRTSPYSVDRTVTIGPDFTWSF